MVISSYCTGLIICVHLCQTVTHQSKGMWVIVDTWCVKCPLVWPSFSCFQLLASLDCVPVQDCQTFWEESTVWLHLLCTSGRRHLCRRHCLQNMRLREWVKDWIILWYITNCIYVLYIPIIAQKCEGAFYYEFTTSRVKVLQLHLFINIIIMMQCPHCEHEEYLLGTACGSLPVNFIINVRKAW